MTLSRRALLGGTAVIAMATALPALAAPQPIYEVIGFKGPHPGATLMLVRIEKDTAHPVLEFGDYVRAMPSDLLADLHTYVTERGTYINADTLRDFKVHRFGGKNRVCWATQPGWDTFHTSEYGTLKLA